MMPGNIGEKIRDSAIERTVKDYLKGEIQL